VATVQLYQRQELPPARVGAVKPEHIPEIGVGEVIAGFAGTVFDKIWATRAANEESEYVGSIETALGEFETAVADNPGISPENLKKLKDATLAKIDDFSKLATLPKSKQYIKGFALKNRGRIGARLNTSVEEIITEQELGRAKINLDMLVAARDSAGVTKLFFGTETEPQGLSGTLIDPETATLMHAAAQDKINVLQSKFDAGEAQADAFDIWQDTITEENPEGDLTKAFEFINADPRIPESDKQEAESELRMRVYNRRAEDERINEENWEKNESEVWKLWRDNNLTYSQIEKMELSKADRDKYTGYLDAESEAGKKSREAETKILEAKDKREAMRFLSEGIEKNEINKSFIYIVAKNYDLTSAELEGFVSYYNANKNAIVSYEPQAELIELITGVQSGKVEPDDVKSKINDMMKASIAAGLPKDEAVTLGLKYREKLATAIKAGEENRSGAYLKTKARNLMEDLIRDKDPLQPDYYTADERQILATAESIIRLENYIDDASKTDKPLEGTELLIKAIEIGRDAKKMINEEKKAETPTIFRPLRRGMEKPVEKPVEKTKGEMPTAPAEKSDYEIWKSVRDKWYRLSTKTKMEIQAALIAINPKTKKRYTWFDVVNDPVIKAEMDKIE